MRSRKYRLNNEFQASKIKVLSIKTGSRYVRAIYYDLQGHFILVISIMVAEIWSIPCKRQSSFDISRKC